jgi:hypothetical protein
LFAYSPPPPLQATFSNSLLGLRCNPAAWSHIIATAFYHSCAKVFYPSFVLVCASTHQIPSPASPFPRHSPPPPMVAPLVAAPCHFDERPASFPSPPSPGLEFRSGPTSLSYPVPRKEGTKPPYVCPGCSNHTHDNNMIKDEML